MPRPADWKHTPISLRDKNVVVSGGTTGIGRSIAQLLAAEGTNVIFYGTDPQHLEDALKDIKGPGQIHGMIADQSKPENVERVFAEVDSRFGGKLDILINNAALPADDTAGSNPEEIVRVINSNLTGYVLCAYHATPRMKKAGAGHIVNIGSMSGWTREAGSGLYVATKAGIQGWSESLRKELGKEGIKVTLIEPGAVGSDMQGAVIKQKVQQLQGKMIYSDDIAECVYYTLTQPERVDVVMVQIRPHGQDI